MYYAAVQGRGWIVRGSINARWYECQDHTRMRGRSLPFRKNRIDGGVGRAESMALMGSLQ